jgi:multidrug resistance efflux pump
MAVAGSALRADQVAAPSKAAVAGPPVSIRLSGTVEAVRSRAVIVPRLAGQTTPTLVITHLVHAGTLVEPGDVIVEFDPQEQQRIALDKRAEVDDLDGQIRKKQADQVMARSTDEGALETADRDISRGKLQILNNRFLPRVDAEKNTLALEQANARYAQLKETFDLKRKAEVADLKVLEIQRERSDLARQYAENNAELMSVKAPFSGLVVLRAIYNGSTQADVQEGQEVRPGIPILDIIDASAMQVRAKLNQADLGLAIVGQAATIRLDAYPGLVFPGKVESVAPLAQTSNLTPTVRTFVAVVSIKGTSPQLMPDLTASVEIAAAAAPATPGGKGGSR